LIEANLILGRTELADGNYDAANTSFKYVVKENKGVMGAESKYNLAYIQF
jgi:lipopolysaccharide biosynthesis regulator YciM